MNDAHFDLQFLSLPVLLGLLAVLLPAFAILYRGDLRAVSTRAGRTLLGLRLILVAVLLTLTADPVYTRRQTLREKGALLVIMDTSGSAALRDPEREAATKLAEAWALGLVDAATREAAERGDTTPAAAGAIDAVGAASRRDLMQRALRSPTLEVLSDRFHLLLYTLAGSLRPAGDLADGRLELPPPGGTTDLGAPVAGEILSRDPGSLAGVLLFSDGNHHAAAEPREALAPLGDLVVPIVCVAVGALERPKDLALAGIDATGKIFADDEIRAQVLIETARLPAGEIPVRVEAGGRRIAEVPVRIPAAAATVRLPIGLPAGAPGRKRFTFSVPVQPGESNTENNRLDLWAEVLSEKARVLLVDGGPRWEWRYLREVWRRDENVDVDVHLITPAPHHRLPEGFPRSREQLFRFDVVAMGDVPPHVFSRAEKDALHDFVTQRGGTLVLIAGSHYLPYAWLDSPVAEVLPVRPLEPPPATDLGAALARDGLRLALTPAGERSVITRLVPGLERNSELWELLPEHYWFSPVGGVARGAEVLVTLSSDAAKRLPGGEMLEASGAAAARLEAELLRHRGAVLVTGSYGAGRVLYAGIDSTWRWRYRLGDELYARFWGQVVRWAVSEQLSAEDPFVRLGTSELLYAADARVVIDAVVRDRDGVPFEAGGVQAVITARGGAPAAHVLLEAIPRTRGRYRGALEVRDLAVRPGEDHGAPVEEYSVELEIPTLPGYSALEDKARVPFVVRPAPDLELRDSACDALLLKDIADLTGGAFLPLARLPEVAAHFPAKHRDREVVVTTAAWDFPLAIACLVTSLLLAEWLLRKRRDLV